MGGSESVQYTHAIEYTKDPKTGSIIYRNPESGEGLIENSD